MVRIGPDRHTCPSADHCCVFIPVDYGSENLVCQAKDNGHEQQTQLQCVYTCICTYFMPSQGQTSEDHDHGLSTHYLGV